jgi:NAD+ kinase
LTDAHSQVVFDVQNAHRRKSSLVAADNPAQVKERRQNTECYVHALLESQRRNGGSYNGGLEGIAETLADRGIINGGGTNTNDNSVVDPKSTFEDGLNDTPGQEDQKSWKQRMQNMPPDENMDEGSKLQIQNVDEANAVHSRLLTKRQLSDMAWGVRELSKRLGSIRLKLKVKTVFLLTKAHDETLIWNTREVAKWLLSPERKVRYTVWVEENLRDNKKFNAQGLFDELNEWYDKDQEAKDEERKLHKRLRYWNNDMCRTRPHTFDFVVTLGGDGTVLYASWLFQRIVPPVLSFALGSLGFLTKFDYDKYEDTLTTAFKDGVTISLRLRFEGTVMRSQKRKRKSIENGEINERDEQEGTPETRDLVEELVGEEKEDERTHRPEGTYEILNDIVVDRGPNPSKFSSKQQSCNC